MLELPDELQLKILNMLHFADVRRLKSVAKKLNQLISDNVAHVPKHSVKFMLLRIASSNFEERLARIEFATSLHGERKVSRILHPVYKL